MSTAAHSFSWLNKQGVRSNAGFEVQFTGRFTVEYREGAKKIAAPVEDGFSAGRAIVIISPGAFSKWDEPFAALKISAEKEREILQNFIAAMEFQGLGVSVE